MPPLVSIIVPVYNEAATVAAVIDRLLEVPFPADREILVVNDGSTDDTRAVLDGRPAHACVRIIHAPRNGGKGSAIRLGLAQALGSVIAIQDADLELDPAQLADLVSPILAGESKVVYGSRFLQPTSQRPGDTLIEATSGPRQPAPGCRTRAWACLPARPPRRPGPTPTTSPLKTT